MPLSHIVVVRYRTRLQQNTLYLPRFRLSDILERNFDCELTFERNPLWSLLNDWSVFAGAKIRW
jgi:hypothetical protein